MLFVWLTSSSLPLKFRNLQVRQTPEAPEAIAIIKDSQALIIVIIIEITVISVIIIISYLYIYIYLFIWYTGIPNKTCVLIWKAVVCRSVVKPIWFMDAGFRACSREEAVAGHQAVKPVRGAWKPPGWNRQGKILWKKYPFKWST